MERRTRLCHSDELQALLTFLASLGVGTIRIAEALKKATFSFEKAAVMLGMPSGNVRQQVHRAWLKIEAILGHSLHVPDRTRVKIRYGADETIYRFKPDRRVTTGEDLDDLD